MAHQPISAPMQHRKQHEMAVVIWNYQERWWWWPRQWRRRGRGGGGGLDENGGVVVEAAVEASIVGEAGRCVCSPAHSNGPPKLLHPDPSCS